MEVVGSKMVVIVWWKFGVASKKSLPELQLGLISRLRNNVVLEGRKVDPSL